MSCLTGLPEWPGPAQATLASPHVALPPAWPPAPVVWPPPAPVAPPAPADVVDPVVVVAVGEDDEEHAVAPSASAETIASEKQQVRGLKVVA